MSAWRLDALHEVECLKPRPDGYLGDRDDREPRECAAEATALQLPSGSATFGGGALCSSVESLTFSDHGGKYRAYYSWKITR